MSVVCQDVIKRRYGLDATNVGDEGGFAPNIQVEQQPASPSDTLCPTRTL